MNKDDALTRSSKADERLRVDDIDGAVALYLELWHDLARCPIEQVHTFKYPDIVRPLAGLAARADALAAAFTALVTPLPTGDVVATHHNWLCVASLAHDDAALVAWFDHSSSSLRTNKYLAVLVDAEVAFALARSERWVEAGRALDPAERIAAYRTYAGAHSRPQLRRSTQVLAQFRLRTRDLGMMFAGGEHVAALNELCELAIANDNSTEMKSITTKLRDFYYNL